MSAADPIVAAGLGFSAWIADAGRGSSSIVRRPSKGAGGAWGATDRRSSVARLPKVRRGERRTTDC